MMMDRVRRVFLADAGLANDEHRQRRAREALEQLERPCHLRMTDHDAALAHHDPRGRLGREREGPWLRGGRGTARGEHEVLGVGRAFPRAADRDRKSTRLNSSHVEISYAVFCLKKKETSPSSGIRLHFLISRLPQCT